MTYLVPFLSVIIGFLIALWVNPQAKKNLKLVLAFSGSYLLSLTLMHLLPEVYHLNNPKIGIFIMIGIMFQIILEFFSKGAEHGHVHIHDKFSRVPWLLFISLCIHAFLEGLPISLNPNLATGIAIHHFPIALILTSFFSQAKLSRVALFLFIFSFSIMTPLGTYIAVNLSFFKQYSTEITALVIGILFHISSTIIFESSEGHKFNIAKISMIIFGIALAYFF